MVSSVDRQYCQHNYRYIVDGGTVINLNLTGVANMTKKLLSGMIMALVISVNCAMAASRSSTVLVVPARYKVVQVAFDIVTLRSVNLISYQKIPGSSDLLLHAWNSSVGAWQKIMPSDLRSGGVFNSIAAAVIGPDGGEFINYIGGRTWGGAVKLLPTYDVAKILSGLSGCYNFKPYEWEWLARRYGVSVKDVNYEQRRYGKYGAPGREKKSRPSVAPSNYQDTAVQVEDVEVVSPVLDEVEVIEIVPATKPRIGASKARRLNSNNDNNMIRLHELLPEN